MSNLEIVSLDHTFHLMYLGWLQCGYGTYPVNEEYERMARQLVKPTATCPHGKTPLTCSLCYFHNPGIT